MPKIIDPMFCEFDHNVKSQAEAADIIMDCAQRANGYPATDPVVDLACEQKTLAFFRKVRKHMYSTTRLDPATREELVRTIRYLQDNGAITVIVFSEGAITKISGSPISPQAANKAAEATRQYADEQRRDQARKDKMRRRHGLRAV